MRPQNVDEYIAHAPEEIKDKLKALRQAIKEAAPDAEEKISYGMPYYHYKGRLVYFRLAKNHIGLYIPPPIVDEFKDELKDYYAKQATIQFPLDKDLPITLIKKLVKARVQKNEKLK